MSDSAVLLEKSWKTLQTRVDDALREYVLDLRPGCPERLRDAINYSLLSGGKRLRPILLLSACEACGGTVEAALPAACAVEMVHTYSLIHDDLPAMDDDDLRRGRPTSHKQFDEATAILAGDALLTWAFEIMASDVKPPDVAAACCAWLAAGAGPDGMVGGQMADVLAERDVSESKRSQIVARRVSEDEHRSGEQIATPRVSEDEHQVGEQIATRRVSEDEQPQHLRPRLRVGLPSDSLDLLESIHLRKTGRLLQASLRIGAHIAGADDVVVSALDEYGKCVGLAFQIADDLLDVGGNRERMGKNVNKDADHGKLTYPALLGEKESRIRARELIDIARRSIASLGDDGRRLDALAQFVLQRDH